MNAKLIDISKKSNIKCEYCGNWRHPSSKNISHICALTGEVKYYYNRCKNFKWRKDREYIDTSGGIIRSVVPFEKGEVD